MGTVEGGREGAGGQGRSPIAAELVESSVSRWMS